MKPDRQDAVLCRLYDAQKALTAAKRLAKRGKLDQAREAILSTPRDIFEAKEAANSGILVTRRVVVEWWSRRPLDGDPYESGIVLTDDTFNVPAPTGRLLTGSHAIYRELEHIFFPRGC
jgi:hypothetical protein